MEANNQTNPLTELAVQAFRKKNFKEALSIADQILHLVPDVALSWRFKGECLFELKRYTEAIYCFDKAIVLGGNGTESLFLFKALALNNNKQREEAKKILKDYIATAPAPGPLLMGSEKLLKDIEKSEKGITGLLLRWASKRSDK